VRRALLIEVRRSPLAWGAPLLVFLGALATWRGLAPGVVLGDTTTTALLGSVQLSGPVAAGLAAWAAGRERRRRLQAVRILGVRSAATPPLLELAACVTWAVATFGVVAVAFVVRDALLDGYGGVSLTVLSAATLGLVVHVVLGYAAGRAVPRAVTPPVVVLALYGAVVLNLDHGGEPFYLLSPVTVEQADAFHTWQRFLPLAQAAWYAALAVAVTGVLALALDRSRTAAAVTVAATCGAALAAGAVLSFDGRFFAPQARAFPYVCSAYTVRVCVHPAFQAALPQLATRVGAVAERLQGTPGSFRAVEQRPRPPLAPPPPGVRAIALDDLAPGRIDAVVVDLTRGLLDPRACLYSAGNPRGVLVSAVVAAWLAGDLDQATWVFPEQERAARTLAAMSEKERRAWLAANFDRFRGCRLTADLRP
jgi:hypothetical protein